MNLIVCIDDGGGMMFNHRRQSRDRVLCARLLELTNGAALWVTPYTAKQFGEHAASLCISQVPWLDAAPGDFYFAEDGEIPTERAERIYLYRWNRLYPSDRKFVTDPTTLGFVLREREDFVGYSHQTITQEIYTKES